MCTVIYKFDVVISLNTVKNIPVTEIHDGFTVLQFEHTVFADTLHILSVFKTIYLNYWYRLNDIIRADTSLFIWY